MARDVGIVSYGAFQGRYVTSLGLALPYFQIIISVFFSPKSFATLTSSYFGKFIRTCNSARQNY